MRKADLQLASDDEPALATYTRAREAHPDRIEPAFGIAAVQVNRLGALQAAYAAQPEADPDMDARWADQLGRARAALEVALTLEPDHPELLQQLTQITGLQGDQEAFQRYETRREASVGR